ncbi:hypothetical protein XELAEV_18033360mg [Xenopus laevis]|uniref:Uncharacterized protein n=1 Tax=Xenopus laevis TaxID=8355 RepID=A0A974CJ71_XENLA|nr:hypothetical protein XELAEV_18033360mg [Xenopus laevis]
MCNKADSEQECVRTVCFVLLHRVQGQQTNLLQGIQGVKLIFFNFVLGESGKSLQGVLGSLTVLMHCKEVRQMLYMRKDDLLQGIQAELFCYMEATLFYLLH